MATSLKESSHSVIVKELGNIGTGGFTCGGTLQTPPTIQLVYIDKFGHWNGATFPGLGNADFQQMLESSNVASFGKGKETVIDQSFRVLETEKCLSSFQVSNTSILGEIKALLVPDVVNIRAELYKINIYTAPAGRFKAHVDTPRAGNMFGSLVVCLPSQFTGGALITRHNGQEVPYNWSSPADGPVQKIQWATFFSDVEHEILPVTEGYRVTMTYNLYHCDEVCLMLDVVTQSKFYNDLKAAVYHPHFLREGGVLGFSCQHAYVFVEFNSRASNTVLLLLKGSDRTIFSAAKALDLQVEVKPILNPNTYCNEEQYVGTKFGVHLGKFHDEYGYDYNGDDDENSYWRQDFENGFLQVEETTGINWCQPLNHNSQWLPSILSPYYGNENSVDICYQAAAILVTVPKWEKRHQ